MMSSPDKRSSYMEPSSPIGRTLLCLAALFVMPSPKKTDGKADRAVDDEPYIDERKLSTTMAAKGNSNNVPVKVNLHNGEHTLIPVTVKMIHSAVQDCERFVLKDGRPLHMVKLVGVVRNFRVHDKNVQIDLEDGTGLLRVFFWPER
jgi:hypothetical protein